jgi:hypothetical protein
MKWNVEEHANRNKTHTEKSRFKIALQLKHHELKSPDPHVQLAVSVIRAHNALVSITREGNQ